MSVSTITENKNFAKEKDKEKEKKTRFDTLLEKYKAKEYNIVVKFLQRKTAESKSKQTGFLYSCAIDYLDAFIAKNYNGKYNVQTILKPLTQSKGKDKDKIDVYTFLDDFAFYLKNDTVNGHDLSPRSIRSYSTAARSYLRYNSVIIMPDTFKDKVKLPRILREEEAAIDANDIKELLNHCDNRRLKAYLLVLASSGCRAMEALTLRECDIDFGNSLVDKSEPAMIHIRKEYTKTGLGRDIFISNEAARYLHDWINWIYRDKTLERKGRVNRQRSKDDLIFSRTGYTGQYPKGLYERIVVEFQKLLERSGLGLRKEDGVYKRRKITFHSFRRFVRTTISNQTGNADYGEWLLGHFSSKTPYYVNTEEKRKQIYKEKCMRYLTFLDYPTVEATSKNFEAQLQAVVAQKDKEIEELKQRDFTSTDNMKRLSDQIAELVKWKEEMESRQSK